MTDTDTVCKDAEPGAPLIAMDGIGLTIGGTSPTRILDGVRLDLHAGTSVAIVGPSGAGKTTLASIIGALQEPTEGSYRFNGTEMVGRSGRSLAQFRAAHLGFVFQHSHLIEQRSTLANVDLGITDSSLSRAERVARCHEALDLVGLAGLDARRAGDLSGGERHRAAIARALVKSPDVLIADEPTAALDQQTGQLILDLLGQVTQRGATLIVVTHDVRAEALADRVVRVVDGVLV